MKNRFFRFANWPDSGRYTFGFKIWFIEEYDGIGAWITLGIKTYAVYFCPHGFPKDF
jgi:hypothetical protein